MKKRNPRIVRSNPDQGFIFFSFFLAFEFSQKKNVNHTTPDLISIMLIKIFTEKHFLVIKEATKIGLVNVPLKQQDTYCSNPQFYKNKPNFETGQITHVYTYEDELIYYLRS